MGARHLAYILVLKSSQTSPPFLLPEESNGCGRKFITFSLRTHAFMPSRHHCVGGTALEIPGWRLEWESRAMIVKTGCGSPANLHQHGVRGAAPPVRR
ncbi:hypothetical protein J2129_001145 [Methanofollis sp. W23]|nr:hypothetical protein [Methanofollis sp. W23]